jgi:hypothetical protein
MWHTVAQGMKGANFGSESSHSDQNEKQAFCLLFVLPEWVEWKRRTLVRPEAK